MAKKRRRSNNIRDRVLSSDTLNLKSFSFSMEVLLLAEKNKIILRVNFIDSFQNEETSIAKAVLTISKQSNWASALSSLVAKNRMRVNELNKVRGSQVFLAYENTRLISVNYSNSKENTKKSKDMDKKISRLIYNKKIKEKTLERLNEKINEFSQEIINSGFMSLEKISQRLLDIRDELILASVERNRKKQKDLRNEKRRLERRLTNNIEERRLKNLEVLRDKAIGYANTTRSEIDIIDSKIKAIQDDKIVGLDINSLSVEYVYYSYSSEKQ